MSDWRPKPAGPNTHRKMYHWVWEQLKTVGNLIGDEGNVTPGNPAPTPGHQHWHDNLIDVKPDQHHPQFHDLNSHTDVNISLPLNDEVLTYEDGVFVNKAGGGGGNGSNNVDGGSASSVYLQTQNISGGSASG